MGPGRAWQHDRDHVRHAVLDARSCGAGDRPGPSSARSEAQRAADAVALAGAAAFRDFPSTEGPTVDSAYTWALNIARQNMVRAYHRCPEPDSTWSTYGWGRVLNVEAPQVTLNIIP